MNRKISVFLILTILCLAFIPVVSADTFGNTNGSAVYSGTTGAIFGTKFTLADWATVTSVSLYTRLVAVPDSVNVAIYADVDGYPDALLFVGNESQNIGTSLNWYTFYIDDGYLVPGDYWLAFKSYTQNIRVYYDPGATNQTWLTVQYEDQWFEDPYPWVQPFAWELCIYATYTPEIEPTPTPSPTPSPAPPTPTLAPWPPTSDAWDNLGALLISVFIPLIIIGVCALLCAIYAGSWGFIAGLNLGVVLCLGAGLVEVWAVVIVVIIDGFLFFGALRESTAKEED